METVSAAQIYLICLATNSATNMARMPRTGFQRRASIENSNEAEKTTKENIHLRSSILKSSLQKDKGRIETELTFTSAVKAAAAMKRPFGDMSAILFFS
jgi:hypothetical protein